MLILLSLIFVCIAVVSSIIGLGGGTFYIITMDLFHLPVVVIPIIALLNNVLVSGVGALMRIYHKETLYVHLILVTVLPAMFSAYIGASLQIKEQNFRFILNFTVLIVVLIRLVLEYIVNKKNKAHKEKIETNVLTTKQYVHLASISAGIGFISGIVGIGGGIILGPVLYLYGISYVHIPLITSLYICINSSIGLVAQLRKLISTQPEWLDMLRPYIYLPAILVLISIVSGKFLVYRIKSKQVRYIVIGVLALLSLYNLIRIGVIYATR